MWDKTKIVSVIDKLRAGQSIFVDYHETIYNRYTCELNFPLIEALRNAKNRGVKVVLWTHNSFYACTKITAFLMGYDLKFDDILCGVEKGTIIIDDKSINPIDKD